jgi:hypothetical protein
MRVQTGDGIVRLAKTKEFEPLLNKGGANTGGSYLSLSLCKLCSEDLKKTQNEGNLHQD